MNPKHKIKKIYSQINYWLGVVAVGLAVGLSIQFVAAWTEPTEAPPGGDLLAPVNVSVNEQAKVGNLGVNALSASSTGNALLVPNGKVGFGTNTPAERLAVNGKIDMMGNNIIRVPLPQNGTDAVNRDYVDGKVGGGEGFVTVAESDSATCTTTEFNKIIQFQNDGGHIVSVKCKVASGVAIPTTYTIWSIETHYRDLVHGSDSIILYGGVSKSVQCMPNYSCLLNQDGGLACDGGWKVIGTNP